MSRLAKWKTEKTKVKVVFRLQFHATHIPHTGWEKLFISFIPADSGKATAKTNKAIVRNGTCKWADPIYESTRLLQDAKTKQFDEKFYKFVVSMGTSRSSILGETTINLAHYADALKPFDVALPLRGCDSEVILHVTVQLLTSKTGFREFEHQRDLREKGFQTTNDQNNQNESGSGKASLSESTVSDHSEKAITRGLNPESRDNPLQAVLNEEYADSTVGFDGSSNASESLCAEKHDTLSTHGSLKSTASGDVGGRSLSQSPCPTKGDHLDHRLIAQGSNDWVHWGSDYSIENDLSAVNEENGRLRASLEVAESSIMELKFEVNSLRSHANEYAIETQKFAQQLAAEISCGRDLENEVSLLKTESLDLKVNLERLSHSLAKRESLKELKKVTIQDPNQIVAAGGFDLDLYGPEDTLHSLTIPGLISHEPDSVNAANVMKANFFELLKELDESKAERDSLMRKMDQMEGYYEALVHELEENQKRLLEDIKNLRNENSTFLFTISSTTAQMETMHHEMDEQILRYAEEKRDLITINKELESRAAKSEAALKRARLNYSIAVDQLQKDLELLSSQVVSMFRANENLIQESFLESVPLSLDEYTDETVQNRNLNFQNESTRFKRQLIGGDMILEDLKQSLHMQEELYMKVEEELFEMHIVNTNLDVFSRTLQQTLLEAMAYSRRMEEEVYQLTHQLTFTTDSNELLTQKVQNSMDDIQKLNDYKATCISEFNDRALRSQSLEAELAKVHSDNSSLNQTLNDLKLSYAASCDDLALQRQSLEAKLESVYSENSLLHQTVNECKANCEAKLHHMAHQIQNLEAELERVASENCLLTYKITEWEPMVIEVGSYKSKYEECAAVRSKLTSSLEQEALTNSSLRNEIASVKCECAEMVYLTENLQNTINCVQGKLVSLFLAHDDQLNGLSLLSKPTNEDMELEDLTAIVSQIEKFQNNACRKILELVEDNKNLQIERDTAANSLRAAEAEIVAVKSECKKDVCKMINKLDITEALLQKFQLDLDRIGNSLKHSSENEEKSSLMVKKLLADFASLGVELREVTLKNDKLAEELLVLETVVDQLERSELTISESDQKNRSLMINLESQNNQYTKLFSDFNSVQEELCHERSVRDQLEGAISELNSQINEKNEQLNHFKLLVPRAELENLSLNNMMMQSEECLKNFHKKSSSLIHLEEELSEMHKHFVAADVKFVFVRALHESQTAELLNKQYDVETKLSRAAATEAHYIEENGMLMMNIESLRVELNASIAQNKAIHDLQSQAITELEQLKNTTSMVESRYLKDQNQKALEVELLNHKLTNAEQIIDNTLLSKWELEIEALLLKEKVDELLLLQNQCNELNGKLSQQVLKTEELQNLCIHLTQLKEKAEAECAQAREKREQAFAAQDSLRIAFIKEQYETKLHELSQQLSISKKHGEEMLWKLQDTIDEVENRKKSEASHVHMNEVLSVKILEVESEMQKIVLDRREKVNVCDRIQAELECALISLECCKEEKKKLETSLQECYNEKAKIMGELTKIKDQREGFATHISVKEDGKLESNGTFANSLNHDKTVNSKEKENACTISIHGGGHLNMHNNLDRCGQGSPVLNQNNSLQNESRHLSLINEHFKAQCLKSSMDHLHSELEKMKNENSFLPRDAQHFESTFQGLQGQLIQLHKANEELASRYPSYNELSMNGNALERVLALEVELAESLHSKRKSNDTLQSSFLKQHADAEAVFKSFRDINELIKDTLETKGRYIGIETELKDMHDRYSQLSLKFAEVEGERQKLTMTLKNVRASKKSLLLCRSSSANLAESSP